MSDVRDQIIETYAQWTALSALRSGAQIKSRRDVYSAIRRVEFGDLFEENRGAITAGEFDQWHEVATERMISGPGQNLRIARSCQERQIGTRCHSSLRLDSLGIRHNTRALRHRAS
jgi:hypothetical protein